MLSKKKQVKYGGCIPPNLKRALQLAKGMDDSRFKTWFGNGCNQVCNRTVPHVAIKMLSCQQKHDDYLDITGYDLPVITKPLQSTISLQIDIISGIDLLVSLKISYPKLSELILY